MTRPRTPIARRSSIAAGAVTFGLLAACGGTHPHPAAESRRTTHPTRTSRPAPTTVPPTTLATTTTTVPAVATTTTRALPARPALVAPTTAPTTTTTQPSRLAPIQIPGAQYVGFDFRYNYRFAGSAQDMCDSALNYLRSAGYDQGSQVSCPQLVFNGYLAGFASSTVHGQLFAQTDGSMWVELFEVA